jgi:hypothetical protein
MSTRLLSALAAYAALALAATFTLDGVFRAAVLVLLAGLAVKTLIAHKAGW